MLNNSKLARQLVYRDTESLISTKNWDLFAIYFLLLLSIFSRGRAVRIRKALTEHDRRVQQIIWEKDVRDQLDAGVYAQSTQLGIDFRVSFEKQPEAWHQGFIGVVVLGIVLPLVVDLVKILVGLAKLP